MHKTIIHKKFSLAKLRDSQQFRVPTEDIVTSMYFGTLCYLNTTDTVTILRGILEKACSNRSQRSEAFYSKVSSVTWALDNRMELYFGFWQRAQKQRHMPEPDLVLSLHYGSENYLIVVEVKWDAGLSGDDQLLKQWFSFKQPLNKRDSAARLHILLVRDTAPYDLRTLLAKEMDWPLAIISWSEVLEACDSVELASWQGRQWREDMRELLKRELYIFQGFAELADLGFASEPMGEVIFWHTFGGFHSLPKLCSFTTNREYNIFYSAAPTSSNGEEGHEC